MIQPLTFEEWKEKYNVVDTSQLANDISEIHGGNTDDLTKQLNDFLYKDYKFYLYRLQNSDSKNIDIPDNWEELVDMSFENK